MGAYKKKLVEQFRLEEERRRYDRKHRYSERAMFQYESGTWDNYSNRFEERVEKRKYNDDIKNIVAEEYKLTKETHDKEEKERVYEKEREQWMKKREVYLERASKFAELKKKRIEAKAKLEHSKQVIKEDRDIWTEFESIIQENRLALKDLEDYRVVVEIKEKEEKEKLELEERVKREHELSDIEKRIKELEISIASLDNQLERFEIEQMNEKTREVKERMSIASSEDQLKKDNILDSKAVDSFIKDKTLWQKYVVDTKRIEGNKVCED